MYEYIIAIKHEQITNSLFLLALFFYVGLLNERDTHNWLKIHILTCMPMNIFTLHLLYPLDY